MCPGTVWFGWVWSGVKAWVFEILKSRVYITQNLSKIFWLNVSGNCLIWLSLEWGEGLSIWDIKISGIYNSKLVKNFLIKCVRELFDLVEFGLVLGFENLINKKKWSKVYSFCFSFWVLSCSILVEKFLKKKGRKIEILKRGFFDQNSGKSIRWKVSGNCTMTWNPQVCEGLSIWDINTMANFVFIRFRISSTTNPSFC